jgi:uncharacterized membrane protein YcaP (DUF421 family)
MAAIFFRTIIIYCLLSVLIKLMGKRQIGELEVSELISTLLISEIASLPIADSDIPLLNAVIPILLIVSVEIILSALKNKSEKLKKFVDGVPTFLIYRGKLRQYELRENRISVNELISELRQQGVGDISDVYYALLEPNGKISILEKGEKENLAHSIIIDTEADLVALKSLGYDEMWLKKTLDKNRVKKKDVFLMTLDDTGAVNIILKEEK